YRQAKRARAAAALSNGERAMGVIRAARNPRQVGTGPDPFQREHEFADALLRLLIAHSRYGASNDADRLPLVEYITILLAHEIAERVEQLRGKDAARAFRKTLARRRPQ